MTAKATATSLEPKAESALVQARPCYKVPVLVLAFCGATAAVCHANAATPDVFGHGAASAGLAQADVADPEPSNAPRGNAAVATDPGFRLRLGYGYGSLQMFINDLDAHVKNASGLDLAAQFGRRFGQSIRAGLALSVHLPDTHLAHLGFRPATEPQFVRYEASLQRVVADMVFAFKLGPLSLGGGVGLGLDVAGDGTDITLGQDAKGTFADASSDVELPYRATPILGLQLDLKSVALGATFRGPMAIDLHLHSDSSINLQGNPLNGQTIVDVTGVSGYDPAVIALGGRVHLATMLAAYTALEYAVYSAAPPPVADVMLDLRLDTVPSQREARFVMPRFRDTLSARVGAELRYPTWHQAHPQTAADPQPAWRWAVRAGYAVSPSPVPPQKGFTSYADATRHTMALGGGYRFGRVWGVDLSTQLAFQLHLLAPRSEDKATDSLPFAHYEVRGRILFAALSVEAHWR